MKPLSTGSEMKFGEEAEAQQAGDERRRARSTIASAAVSAANASPSRRRDRATVAADSAAVADIGPTTRWRELPKAA